MMCMGIMARVEIRKRNVIQNAKDLACCTNKFRFYPISKKELLNDFH